MALSLDSRRRTSNDDGFTLIELLIVIVILGILAAIVVFSVKGITDKGEKAACKSDVETLSVAEEAYYAGNGTSIPGGSYTDAAGLKAAGLIRSIPSSSKYTITVDSTTGAVTGSIC
ncbi:hypothetical protein GCM10011584_05790 [Nocardioides phosphati]|uniref:Prepilin-type N-terminal cleavage/methylation domain-containing protein n=1 Tax=Nocardioides phosphati TaxID=1867775 RepID=A0ABQ2N6V6_9ACTN|nr:prepilin-type N-terminal cleavage/methylation domain-containing protein [Nocardioides phosphati]GGO85555.1 hypothetical protein GCM10011584_05790 [Nocardioides phosphati]